MFVVYVYIICFFYKMYHVKYFLSVWSNWLDWPPVVVFVAVLADDDHLSGISHLAIFLAANSLIIAFFHQPGNHDFSRPEPNNQYYSYAPLFIYG